MLKIGKSLNCKPDVPYLKHQVIVIKITKQAASEIKELQKVANVFKVRSHGKRNMQGHGHVYNIIMDYRYRKIDVTVYAIVCMHMSHLTVELWCSLSSILYICYFASFNASLSMVG